MKKLALLTIICITLTFVCSCKSTPNYYSKISQLRQSVLLGESSKYKVCCYLEQKEKPFINDCYVSPKKNYATIKLQLADNSYVTDSVEAKIKIDKDYYFSFEYLGIATILTATCEINYIPTESVDITISYEGLEQTITLTNAINQNTLSYVDALNCLIKNDKHAKEMLFGKENYELYVRLIVNENQNFWYVGFAKGEDKIEAYLLDGVSGEPIAHRA